MPIGHDAHEPGSVHAFAPMCSHACPSIRRAWAFTRAESVTIHAGQSFSVANQSRPRSLANANPSRPMFRRLASCLKSAAVPVWKSGKPGLGLAPDRRGRAARGAVVMRPPASSIYFRQASFCDRPDARWKKSTASPASPVAKSFHKVPSAFTLKLGLASARNGEWQDALGSPSNPKCRHRR